jgi:hypothetical protein
MAGTRRYGGHRERFPSRETVRISCGRSPSALATGAYADPASGRMAVGAGSRPSVEEQHPATGQCRPRTHVTLAHATDRNALVGRIIR